MTDKEKDVSPEPGEAEAGYSGEDEAAGQTTGTRPESEDEVARLRTRLAYLAAEFDNYRKRAVKEKEDVQRFGSERLLKDDVVLGSAGERKVDGKVAVGGAAPKDELAVGAAFLSVLLPTSVCVASTSKLCSGPGSATSAVVLPPTNVRVPSCVPAPSGSALMTSTT